MPAQTTPTFISIKPTGFLARKRGKDVLAAIERGMLLGARLAVPTVKTFTPEDRGFLKDSYQVQFVKRPRRALITSTSPPGKVGSMESGRGANKRFPPVGAIRRWVERKLNVAEDKIKQVAFLVGRKIARLGIQTPLKISGKGAMFRRTVDHLGGKFFANIIRDQVNQLR